MAEDSSIPPPERTQRGLDPNQDAEMHGNKRFRSDSDPKPLPSPKKQIIDRNDFNPKNVSGLRANEFDELKLDT